jgi:hypothetical protein
VWPVNTWPTDEWPICDGAGLDHRLADGVWALDNLFSWLRASVQVNLPSSHDARLCCTLESDDEHSGMLGVVALLALVLFHGRRLVRCWVGAIDPSLLRYNIDTMLTAASAMPCCMTEAV